MKKFDRKIATRDITYMGLCVGLLILCSWFSIPMVVSFTMQTFAIFFIVLFLGPVKSFISLTVWVLLGLMGVPVFTNFQGGIGVIMGPTGGYILGFFATPLIYLLASMIFKKNKWVIYFVSMFLGLVICYLIGTVWFVYIYSNNTKTFLYVMSVCVFPFILPDLAKLALAGFIGYRINIYMNKKSIEPLNKYFSRLKIELDK